MDTAKTTKNAAKLALGAFEGIIEETKPKAFLDEARSELFSFFGSSRVGDKPKEIAKAELFHARVQQQVEQQDADDKTTSEAHIQKIMAQYREYKSSEDHRQSSLKQELTELQSEVVQLAKTAGVDTKVHLQNTPKVGKIDIKFLTFIIRILRVKAEQSKSAKDLVTERQNAKRSTGMLAWVSGKQMKIHEQGTLQLQG